MLKFFVILFVIKLYARINIFLNKIDTTMPSDPITISELKEAFFFP